MDARLLAVCLAVVLFAGCESKTDQLNALQRRVGDVEGENLTLRTDIEQQIARIDELEEKLTAQQADMEFLAGELDELQTARRRRAIIGQE